LRFGAAPAGTVPITDVAAGAGSFLIRFLSADAGGFRFGLSIDATAPPPAALFVPVRFGFFPALMIVTRLTRGPGAAPGTSGVGIDGSEIGDDNPEADRVDVGVACGLLSSIILELALEVDVEGNVVSTTKLPVIVEVAPAGEDDEVEIDAVESSAVALEAAVDGASVIEES
jgi:hypothetical protein